MTTADLMLRAGSGLGSSPVAAVFQPCCPGQMMQSLPTLAASSVQCGPISASQAGAED